MFFELNGQSRYLYNIFLFHYLTNALQYFKEQFLSYFNLVQFYDDHFIIMLNRPVRVIDDAVAKDSVTNRVKVEEGNDLQIGAPMKGEVLEIKVALGDAVEKGQGKEADLPYIIVCFSLKCSSLYPC